MGTTWCRAILSSFFVLFFTTFTLSAQRKLTGVVKDEGGSALPGVRVMVVGTKVGTATDVKGSFAITLPVGKNKLSFSYMGFQTRTVKVGSKTHFEIILKEGSQILEEVVVVGMGTQKRNTITAAVSTVNSEAINNRPVSDITAALQGNVAGLNIATSASSNATGGELGSEIKFDIRGIGSINGGDPYVLIDGVEQSMQNVNHADVASVTVLKDASAAAVYGARAAYGVVLITTKSGKSGKMKLNYNGSFGASSPINMPRMMNSIEHAHYVNAYQRAIGFQPIFSEEAIEKMQHFMNAPYSDEYPGISPNVENTYWRGWQAQYANTDWFDYYFKDFSTRQYHNLSASGGTDKIRYYLGFGYNKTSGLMDKITDELSKYNLNSKLEMRGKKLKINFNNNVTLTDIRRPLPNMSILYHEFARTRPNLVTHLPIKSPYNLPGYNYFLYLKETAYNEKRLSDAMTISATISPFLGWDLKAELKARLDILNREFAMGQPSTERPDGVVEPITGSKQGFLAPGVGWKNTTWNSYYRRSDMGYYLSPNLMTSYTKEWNRHFFKGMFGFQAEYRKDGNIWGYKGGVQSPDAFSFLNASGDPYLGEDRTHWATMGFYTKLNWNYANIYFAEFSGRYDGSSRFAPGHRWGLFPSFSLGYDMARTEYFQKYNLPISQLKLRASYGSLGNQNGVGLYSYYGFVNLSANNGAAWLLPGVNNTPSVGLLAFTPGQLSKTVTWETVTNANLGLDITAFKDRLSITADIYQRITDNMVGPAEAIPHIGGLDVGARSKVNNATLRNRGWELTIGWRDKFDNGFHYGINANLSDYKAIVTRYNNPEGIINNNHTGLWRNRGYYTGMDLGEIWGYKADDLFITNAEVDEYVKNVDLSYFKPNDQWQRGDLKYLDINNDGKVDPGNGTLTDHGDLTIIGNTTPHYSYGINLSVGYKGLELTALFQGVGSRQFPIAGSTYMFCGNENFFKEHLDYYSIDNPNGFLPRLSAPNSTDYRVNTSYNTTRYLLDASYMRLKNLMLSYSFGEAILERLHLSNVRVYATADNLLTFTKLPKMFDPETINQVSTWAGGSGAVAPGLTSPLPRNGNGKVYPLNRSFVIGLDISF